MVVDVLTSEHAGCVVKLLTVTHYLHTDTHTYTPVKYTVVVSTSRKKMTCSAGGVVHEARQDDDQKHK